MAVEVGYDAFSINVKRAVNGSFPYLILPEVLMEAHRREGEEGEPHWRYVSSIMKEQAIAIRKYSRSSLSTVANFTNRVNLFELESAGYSDELFSSYVASAIRKTYDRHKLVDKLYDASRFRDMLVYLSDTNISIENG